ncbi:MAG: type II toxin-antitoxin system prevent-host-death family antitoxin [Fibromonadales bacterium]|nr:type II toxin-antitoxin system prevent-host-death family antitoxin [Fibromonadales bacterium]
MQTFNIHEAKTHLSFLIDNAMKGNPFVIAKAGKPMVKVVPIAFEEAQKKRIGFMKGKISTPNDFDSMGQKEIENLFNRKTAGYSQRPF